MSLGKQIFICFLALLCAWSPAYADTDADHGLSKPCTYVSDGSPTPQDIVSGRLKLDCIKSVPLPVSPVTWAVIGDLNLQSNAADPLLFRHDTYQFQHISAFVQLADGSIAQLPSYTMGPPGLLSSTKISWRLPNNGKVIKSIVLRVDGLQHLRGAAPNARIKHQSEALKEDVAHVIFYALIGGALLTLFLYNVALFVMLRYPFILAYCCTTLSMLVFGMAWSSVPMNVWPEFRLIDQISLQLLMIPVSVYLIILFMLTFIERDMLNSRLRFISLSLAAIACLAGLTRLIDVNYAWQTIDKIYYGSLTAALIAMLVTAFFAWRKGSSAAGLYALIWSFPVVAAAIRAVWGLGLIQTSNSAATMSPMLIIIVEVGLSAFAVSWRIGKLKIERDTAKHLESQLRELAETDPLTGLLNRRSFVEQACKDNLPKQLVLIDIDQFKLINDAHGHQLGDDVLIHLAKLLRDHSPPSAIVGRLGGEEFAVLIRADMAPGLAEALRVAVLSSPFPGDLKVTVSAGFVFATIANEEDWTAAYTAADGALYAAKREGRNQVRQTSLGLAA
jgi:diguanylate cyclase (GGDEF)-like protein